MSWSDASDFFNEIEEKYSYDILKYLQQQKDNKNRINAIIEAIKDIDMLDVCDRCNKRYGSIQDVSFCKYSDFSTIYFETKPKVETLDLFPADFKSVSNEKSYNLLIYNEDQYSFFININDELRRLNKELKQSEVLLSDSNRELDRILGILTEMLRIWLSNQLNEIDNEKRKTHNELFQIKVEEEKLAVLENRMRSELKVREKNAKEKISNKYRDEYYLEWKHPRQGWVNRKAGWFAVIVGKSMKEKDFKRFGFVKTYDEKSKRRLFETLKSQGFQFNQQITFLSDGGESVRDLQLYMSPQAEHVLDWFYVTMRITRMKQMSKRLASHEEFKNIENKLKRIKWFLWHGNVFKALKTLDDMLFDIECFEDDPEYDNLPKFAKAVREFRGYIYNNREFIPNYGDRHHYGEAISTAFVESTVNEVVSRRMVKKQQMRWSRKGAHNMLQLRTKTLNNELQDTFQRWYPGMMTSEGEINSEPQALMN